MPENIDVRVVNTLPTFLTTPQVGRPGQQGQPFFAARRLSPGGNNVPRDMVQALNQMPIWQSWQTSGVVQVFDDATQTAQPEGPQAPADLSNRKPEAAEAMIAVESNPEVLRRWLQNEKRRNIREAIESRLLALGQGGTETRRG